MVETLDTGAQSNDTLTIINDTDEHVEVTVWVTADDRGMDTRVRQLTEDGGEIVRSGEQTNLDIGGADALEIALHRLDRDLRFPKHLLFQDKDEVPYKFPVRWGKDAFGMHFSPKVFRVSSFDEQQQEAWFACLSMEMNPEMLIMIEGRIIKRNRSISLSDDTPVIGYTWGALKWDAMREDYRKPKDCQSSHWFVSRL